MTDKQLETVGYAVSVALDVYDGWHDDCPKCTKDKLCKELATMRGDLLDAWKAVIAKDVTKEAK